jgi:hypothetical protein
MSNSITSDEMEEGGMPTIYSTAFFIEDDVAPMPRLFTEDLVDYLYEEVGKKYAGEVWVLVHKDEIARFSYETEDQDEIEKAEEIKEFIHSLISEFRRYRLH